MDTTKIGVMSGCTRMNTRQQTNICVSVISWSLEQRFISKNQQGHNWVAGLYASQQTIDLTRLYTWLDQNFISDFERDRIWPFMQRTNNN